MRLIKNNKQEQNVDEDGDNNNNDNNDNINKNNNNNENNKKSNNSTIGSTNNKNIEINIKNIKKNKEKVEKKIEKKIEKKEKIDLMDDIKISESFLWMIRNLSVNHEMQEKLGFLNCCEVVVFLISKFGLNSVIVAEQGF
jgi:hypothetical protein